MPKSKSVIGWIFGLFISNAKAFEFDMNNPKIQPINDFDLGIIQPQTNRMQ